jgi:hypothetical protein
VTKIGEMGTQLGTRPTIVTKKYKDISS